MSEKAGKIVFAIVVAIVIGFAIFTQVRPSGQEPSPTPTPSVAIPNAPHLTPGAGKTDGTTTPAPGAPVPGTDGIRVGNLFSDADLAVAAQRGVEFLQIYNSRSYSMNGEEWLKKAQAYLAPETDIDLNVLPRGADRDQAVRDKRVTEISKITAVKTNAVGPTFATFEVEYVSTTTTSAGKTDTPVEIVVVMTRTGDGAPWLVQQFEDPADAH